MNKNSLIKIGNISAVFLFLLIVVSFFLESKSCYSRGLDILIGISFVILLSTIVWYPDFFAIISAKRGTPADKIPSWKDVASSRKTFLAIAVVLGVVLFSVVIYSGVSHLVTRSCV